MAAGTTMGGQDERRVKVALPVQVLGMGADGRPVREKTHTVEISPGKAVLRAHGSRFNAGEVVSLQYADRKARYRVVWVGPAGTPEADQLGLEQVNPADNLFPLDVICPEPNHKHQDRGPDRRRRPRFETSLPMEITVEGSKVVRATVTDLSLGGCYVPSLFAISADTHVTLVFWLGEDRIEAQGVVRASAPSVGFGIEFLDLNTEQRKLLSDYLKTCAPVADRRAQNPEGHEHLDALRFGETR